MSVHSAVDASLLASTLLRPATALWTLDKRLATLADELGCGDRALERARGGN